MYFTAMCIAFRQVCRVITYNLVMCLFHRWVWSSKQRAHNRHIIPTHLVRDWKLGVFYTSSFCRSGSYESDVHIMQFFIYFFFVSHLTTPLPFPCLSSIPCPSPSFFTQLPHLTPSFPHLLSHPPSHPLTSHFTTSSLRRWQLWEGDCERSSSSKRTRRRRNERKVNKANNKMGWWPILTFCCGDGSDKRGKGL